MDLTKPFGPDHVENIEPGDPQFWQPGAPPYWLNQDASENVGAVDVNLPNPNISPGINHATEHESPNDSVSS